MFSIKLINFIFAFLILPFYSNEKLKPTNDFSWMIEFIPLTESVTVEHWETDPAISFNDKGWALANKNSNPVTISQYALVCFDTYRRTKDDKHKKAFLNQVSYLMDKEQYHILGEGRVGYPYKFTFHDLKPDWYSGLAQAEAISVLIRYYYLTKDEEALDLIIKLKNQMLWPMEDGGLLAKTPEGGVWIEEYPNSKQHKHVLNGFFISTFGLYEYTKLFPGDKEAKEIYLKCIQSLKQSINKYDTGSWLQYDRGNKGLVSNWYMKAQVLEMKMLYKITNDTFFHRQHLLWSTYPYNKPIEYYGCMLNNFNFSVPAIKDESGWYVQSHNQDLTLLKSTIARYENSPVLKKNITSALFDKSTSTFFQPLKNDTIKEVPFAAVHLNKPATVDYIILTNISKDQTNYDIDIHIKSDSTASWKVIKHKKIYLSGTEIQYKFKESAIYGLKIAFKMKSNSIVKLSDLNMGNSAKKSDNFYIHYLSEFITVKDKKIDFKMNVKNADPFTIFYKCAPNQNALKKAKWSIDQYSTNNTFTAEKCDSLCQFLIVFKNQENSGIRDLKFTEMQ